MTSIWFPNNKYPPNTKNYLPCFVLGGGGFSIRRKGLSWSPKTGCPDEFNMAVNPKASMLPIRNWYNSSAEIVLLPSSDLQQPSVRVCNSPMKNGMKTSKSFQRQRFMTWPELTHHDMHQKTDLIRKHDTSWHDMTWTYPHMYLTTREKKNTHVSWLETPTECHTESWAAAGKWRFLKVNV